MQNNHKGILKMVMQKWLNSDYLIIDTETTGLDNNAEIIEIAIINMHGDVLLNSLVKPTCSIPTAVTKINNITDEMVADEVIDKKTMDFIAAANPATMLALLDELDSANGYASAYEAEKWHYHGLAESEGERADRAEKQVEELTMWIKRLAYSLRNTRPDSKLHIDAMDYLSSKGLISVEDVLR
ncbi:hypothetical protein E4470_21395 [Salmonella enterica subsp. enterica]|nr:hypothetical protein [Salmonella enterica subsp. enterica]